MIKVVKPTWYFHPCISKLFTKGAQHYHWHFIDGRVRCNKEDKGSKDGPGQGKACSRS